MKKIKTLYLGRQQNEAAARTEIKEAKLFYSNSDIIKAGYLIRLICDYNGGRISELFAGNEANGAAVWRPFKIAFIGSSGKIESTVINEFTRAGALSAFIDCYKYKPLKCYE